jgi:crotonobetainyl-CoA:carnitine CoA-transferase CaiB-like acyl-CoA transferase
VEINGQPLKIPAMSPRLTETPGRTDWPGAEVGAHNDEILGGLLGLAAEDIERLRDSGII